MSLGNPSPPVLDGSEDVSRGPTFLKLTWSAVTDAVKYRLRCNAHSQEFVQPGVPFAAMFTGLPANTLHNLSLEVEDAAGNVKLSAVVSKFTRPHCPSFLSLTSPVEGSRKPKSVVLSWQDVAGIDIYEVERDSTEVRKTGDSGNSGFEFTGLAPNVLYTFHVRSRVEEPSGRVDVSFKSDPLSVLTRPPTPDALTLIPQSGQQARISWNTIPAFNNSQLAKVQLGRTRGTNPADEILALISSIGAHTHVDGVISGEALLYGVRVIVGGNESFWTVARFATLNASAILLSDVSQMQARQRSTFLSEILRGVNE